MRISVGTYGKDCAAVGAMRREVAMLRKRRVVVEAIEGFCGCADQALLEVIAEVIVIYARWKWMWRWFANPRPMRLMLPLFKR